MTRFFALFDDVFDFLNAIFPIPFFGALGVLLQKQVKPIHLESVKFSSPLFGFVIFAVDSYQAILTEC